MDWRLKCLALHALRVPGADACHKLLQRYITRRYFAKVAPNLGPYRQHLENYRSLDRVGRALEFGCGPDLQSALLLSSAGAEVFAFDLQRLASPDRINNVIRQFRELGVPGEWQEISTLDDLERYRIHYRAPADARDTGLPAGSIDFFCSTSVMEHIPEPDLEAILRECMRLAAPGALMSFWIGYYDHYATFDRSISRFHFYRYTEAQWRWWNPPRHFHNRLRHSDFERLFERLGLKTLTNERMLGKPEELRGIPLAEPFRRYSVEDLLTVYGRFALGLDHVAGTTRDTRIAADCAPAA